MMDAQHKKVIIIGGGAAGFFCAANLQSNHLEVTILEQNKEVLQKVKISGGGRCNVTHACFDPQDLVQFYPRGNKELRSVFSKFQPADTMTWFEDRGVSLKIESDNRVFPESDSSSSIINLLQDIIKNKNITVETSTTVKEIYKKNEGYLITTNKNDYFADIIVFATGSSPKSLKLLQNLGHTIVDLVPSLFTFNSNDVLLQNMQGTTFPNALIEIPELKSHESGALLITHWGISGPAVLKISAWEARELAEKKYQFSIHINFLNTPIAELEQMFISYKKQNPKKTIHHAKIFPVTQRFWEKILEISGVSRNKQVAHITTSEMQTILQNLGYRKIIINGKSTYKDEFVTAGGVDCKEINFKNMTSKMLPNFYIAGEVLNIDAVTGGFNFQACWSEAWLISSHINNSFS